MVRLSRDLCRRGVDLSAVQSHNSIELTNDEAAEHGVGLFEPAR
jgi:hypothetical protein